MNDYDYGTNQAVTMNTKEIMREENSEIYDRDEFE